MRTQRPGRLELRESRAARPGGAGLRGTRRGHAGRDGALRRGRARRRPARAARGHTRRAVRVRLNEPVVVRLRAARRQPRGPCRASRPEDGVGSGAGKRPAHCSGASVGSDEADRRVGGLSHVHRPLVDGSEAARERLDGCRALLVPVEVARRALLEPQPVVLRRLLEEVRRVLEDVAPQPPRAGGRATPRPAPRRARPRATGRARARRSAAAPAPARPARAPRRRTARQNPPQPIPRPPRRRGSARAPRARRTRARPPRAPQRGRTRPAADWRPSDLALLTLDLGEVGAARAFELQMLADGVVEQSHAVPEQATPWKRRRERCAATGRRRWLAPCDSCRTASPRTARRPPPPPARPCRPSRRWPARRPRTRP